MSDILTKFTNNVSGLVTSEEITESKSTPDGSLTAALGGDAAYERKYDDEAALKILTQDVETCDADMVLKNWTQQWSMADTLMSSPMDAKFMYNPSRANVPRFTLSNIVDVQVNKIHSGIFFDTPAFMCRPNPKIDQKLIFAKQTVLQTQLREMEFETEVRQGLFQCAVQGTQIYKWGWLSTKKVVPFYQRKADPIEVPTPTGTKSVDTVESDSYEIVKREVITERPWLKWKDLKWLLINPAAQVGDIRKAGWVVDRDYVTFDDLDQLRDIEGYDIPNQEDLKKLFFPPNVQEPAQGNIAETLPASLRAWIPHSVLRNTNTSADPYANKIEILERWDDGKVMTALHNNRGYLLIRNETNKFGCIPYFSSNWRDVANNFFGQGLGVLIGPDQRVEQGTLNAYLNILAFVANPSYVRQKTVNTVSQNESLELGRILSVEGPVNDAFGLIKQPEVPISLINAIEAAKNSAASTSGANELVGQGNAVGGGQATGMRSGTGSALVGQANASRADGVIDRFVRQVFIPWLYKMDELNSERLPSKVLREILGADAAHEYDGLNHLDFRNHRADFEVLAGAGLGPRKQMAQFMPFIQQMVNSPALLEDARQAGMKFDFEAFLNMFTNLAGFPYSQPFFKKMSPEELQQAQANSPAAMQQQKLQAEQTMQKQKEDADLNKQNAASLGRAANEVTRQAIQKSMTSLAVEGVPGNQGFGDVQT